MGGGGGVAFLLLGDGVAQLLHRVGVLVAAAVEAVGSRDGVLNGGKGEAEAREEVVEV